MSLSADEHAEIARRVTAAGLTFKAAKVWDDDRLLMVEVDREGPLWMRAVNSGYAPFARATPQVDDYIPWSELTPAEKSDVIADAIAKLILRGKC